MSGSNYSMGGYKFMNIHEKIDFLHKVHTAEISLWDENGNDNDIWNDYHIVQDELIKHPELFCLEDILCIMAILDDNCFEITWEYHLAHIIFKIALYHGKGGITFLLQNLQKVPEKGRFHGWHFPIQWIIGDEIGYPLLKEVLPEQSKETISLILQILDNIDIFNEKKNELAQILNVNN